MDLLLKEPSGELSDTHKARVLDEHLRLVSTFEARANVSPNQTRVHLLDTTTRHIGGVRTAYGLSLAHNLTKVPGSESMQGLEPKACCIDIVRVERRHVSKGDGVVLANDESVLERMSDGPFDDDDLPSRGDVATKTRAKTQRPSLYKVLLLNDDYTPMEFVIVVLERFFGKNREDATQVMLHVHQRGVGVCGVYTFEVAETKVTQVVEYAREHQHPLQCTMEKE